MMDDDEFVGLDTNVLIDFIQNPLTKQFVFGLRSVQDKELCTSEACIIESKNVLTEKYKSKDAEGEINTLLCKNKINVLKLTEIDKKLAKELFFKYESDGAHLKDMLILANFINNNVRIIVGADYTFQKIIEKEGLCSVKIPSSDRIQDIMFKRSVFFK